MEKFTFDDGNLFQLRRIADALESIAKSMEMENEQKNLNKEGNDKKKLPPQTKN